jgi:hypothetical protein
MGYGGVKIIREMHRKIKSALIFYSLFFIIFESVREPHSSVSFFCIKANEAIAN